MFENPYFLWLRRVELSIWNQEFLLEFSRSDVNTCALLQRGYIVYREWDKFWRQSGYWLSLKLDSLRSFSILAHSAKTVDPTGICVSQKKPQNKIKIPKQTKNQNRPQVWQDLAQLEDLEFYCLFYQEAIQPLGYSWAPWALCGPRSPEGMADLSSAGLWSVS